ncbi:MAG: cytochrome c [Desulfobulbaceae bacterium]|nr:cytochrome c [Desulfobulbaceae bacterium]
MFKAKCGACHIKGGEAAPVNPGEKAASVWEKYFKRGRHPVDLKMTESEIGVVVQYLINHAADSDHPEMLAIPK